MNDFTRMQLSALDTLKMHAGTLRDEIAAQRDGISTVADVDALASACETLWRQLKSVDLLVHELLVHEGPSVEPLTPPSSDSMLACINGGLAQVVGVMSNEHDLTIARSRLLVANALACRALNALDGQIADVTTFTTEGRGPHPISQ